MTFGSTFGRTFSPTFQPKSQAKKGGGWWNLDGTLTSCILAYQAKGVASLAASKVDLSGNGYNIDGGSDPSWNTSTGWEFNGSSHFLLASGVPIYNGDFTLAIFCKPVTISSPAFGATLFSVNPVDGANANKGWMVKSEQEIRTQKLGYTQRAVANYTSTIATPTTDTVIMLTKSGTSVNYYAGANSQSITVSATYYNTVTAGILIGATYKNSTETADYYKNLIYALAYYNEVLSSGNRSSLMTAMAAL